MLGWYDRGLLFSVYATEAIELAGEQKEGSEKMKWLLTALIVVAMAQPANAVGYTCTDLGTLGGEWSQAFAINENNVITGTSQKSSDTDQGFVWDGSMHGVGTLGSKVSWSYGINIHNEAVGWSSPSDGSVRAFTYDGVMHQLDPLWGHSWANGINDQGHVVGYSQDDTGYAHATKWVNGVTQDLGVLGGYYSSRALGINNLDHTVGYSWRTDGKMTAAMWDASGSPINLGSPDGFTVQGGGRAINNSDVVVGFADSNTERAAFYWDGSMHTLPWLSNVHTAEALGINDHNDIVGYALDSSQLSHPILWKSDGSMVDLNQYLLGWSGSSVIDINNNGLIVGMGTNSQGYLRGFVLTPVPEPNCLLALSSGLVGLIGIRWKRK